MKNTATTAEERLKKNIDISRRASLEEDELGRRWHYINLKEFEFQIRQEELEKYMALRKRERDRKRWYREAKIDLFKATLIPRFIGALLIAMTIFTAFLFRAMGDEVIDGTWMLWTGGMGLILLTMPGCNKPHK